MNQQLLSNEKDKPTVNSTPRLSLQITGKFQFNFEFHVNDKSSRALSRVAFFHDGFLVNKTDLQKNLTGAQRRAQAIATAPRRKRYDDDDDDDDEEEVDEAKKSIQFFFR